MPPLPGSTLDNQTHPIPALPGHHLFHRPTNTFADHLLLTRAFLTGTLTSSATQLTPLASESTRILPHLLAMNSGGYMSVSSQPGMWEDGRRQKAYVEGFIERGWWERFGGREGMGRVGRVGYYSVREVQGGDGMIVTNVGEEGDATARDGHTHPDPSGSYIVTQRLTDPEGDWMDCTRVYFHDDLQETMTLMRPRYHDPGRLLQCVFAAREGGSNELFEVLVEVFKAPYPIIVQQASGSEHGA
ncbi:uncharacterized protein EV422DRAFT_510019 [Fimicolochytrium jonesii]|uniref:uncharacterized protein n=1 Tax=Fimicolochytrium jonesii TaxID=1396493 RepID=UPI0022FE4035|nr:uncharacterized protein EV422DRAFT_510019 [Fimicolochytrium jonesii]KAI8816159.1 hypothetical protein EV422DRAFT_510019 [Fimicolochytrium jonesii]